MASTDLWSKHLVLGVHLGPCFKSEDPSRVTKNITSDTGSRMKDYLSAMLSESRWLHHEHRLVFYADAFRVPSACPSITILSLGSIGG
ncbi:hypothetical protein FVEG_14757 [Fusarium verticillioides 7600]|nr:hypothetical protein FVEG_14757 [Fusarium verticillioides 7600]XP_018743506.1 hypothetical protein FVEG_14757 [Fusarium verticillioides 7600]EWG37314.1 hypothetical protein FVEG_14757 [Fusarium verticillioides 7600]EWG37315.1 hypothetical protein FVEG_14757 [Fusarium verticillioides 7600]